MYAPPVPRVTHPLPLPKTGAPAVYRLRCASAMDHVWGPVTAARIGYFLSQHLTAADVATHFGQHPAYTVRLFYGCGSHLTALRVGRAFGIDVAEVVNDIARDPAAHAIPTIKATKQWSELTSCRDMWKMDTLRPYINNIVSPYNGVDVTHYGALKYPTLVELLEAVRAHIPHVKLARTTDAFRYATFTFDAMCALAQLCRYPLPKADKYTRYIYTPGADEGRRGFGFGPQA